MIVNYDRVTFIVQATRELCMTKLRVHVLLAGHDLQEVGGSVAERHSQRYRRRKRCKPQMSKEFLKFSRAGETTLRPYASSSVNEL
jgi:hypothetical protein